MNDPRLIHNIVAASVNLETGFREIQNDFLGLVRGYPIPKDKDNELFRKMKLAARQAAEQVLLENQTENEKTF